MYFFSHSVWLAALGSSLVNSFWQMALMWLLYTVITGNNSRFSARRRHALALGFMALGTAWFVICLVIAVSWQDSLNSGLPAILFNADSLLLHGFYTGRQWINVSLPWLSFAYLFTLLFLAIRYIRFYTQLRRIRSSGLSKMTPEMRLFTNTVSGQMGIGKKVSIWLSSVVDGPVTIGFFKPIILVPIATINHLTTEQVEAILLHELAHIKRNDYLVNLLVTWTGMIFFFNPFCKLFIQQIKKEREHCCDDLVVQFQYNPHNYASALLSLERSRHGQAVLAMAAAGKSQQLLLERVRRLTGHSHPRSKQYVLAVVPLFLLSLLFAVLMLLEQQSISSRWIAAIAPAAPMLFSETYPKTYSSSPVMASEKSRKPTKRKARTSTNLAAVADDGGAGIEWVSSQQGESSQDDPADLVVTAAGQSEEREFSIASSPDPALPATVVENNFPYVPSASFSFQIQEDSARVTHIHDSDSRQARRSIIKALRALKEEDWEAINERITDPVSDADEERMKENIELQIQSLKTVHLSNPKQALQLKTKIRAGQLKLKQVTIERQLESIRKQNEQVRKAAKVVYI
ncbi:MAG TPA: M56 family metallopeptidase [Puia sp.]|nr:M56 family metallopeptidase [Puia sp.]